MQTQSQLAHYRFEKFVLKVAIATLERGGVTSKLDTCQILPSMDTWCFPKYPSKTMIVPPEVDLVEELKKYISANKQYLRESDSWLGTWINPQTQCIYLDVTTSCSELNKARKMALDIGNREHRKVVALYNSKRRETVYL